MKKHSKRIWICVGILIAIIVASMLFLLPHTTKIFKDFKRIETEEYDTLFLSMYPIDYYEDSDFMLYRGMDVLSSDYCIPNGKILKWYLSKVKDSNHMVGRAYVIVDPEHASKEDIVMMIQENPDTFFEVALPYPQIDYWLNMKEDKFEKVMEQYQSFTEWIVPLENAALYMFGNQEWLVGNPKNYADMFNTNAEVSEFLLCNMDEGHSYQVTFDNLQEEMADYHRIYKECQNRQYPDASGVEILFFGDSIIGNFTDSMSIPQVVAGHTNATVYNLGCGGSSAAASPSEIVDFSTVADAFLQKDISKIPQDSPNYEKIKGYFSEVKEDAPKMFVVNYGMNDYFLALPLKSEDPYDITTYGGALRTNVKKLKDAYPDSQIVLMTPHFTSELDFGRGKVGDGGYALKDYAEMVVTVAQELDVDVLDNFKELGITEANWREYQPDGTHPNEKGRYLLGTRIAEKIKCDK